MRDEFMQAHFDEGQGAADTPDRAYDRKEDVDPDKLRLKERYQPRHPETRRRMREQSVEWAEQMAVEEGSIVDPYGREWDAIEAYEIDGELYVVDGFTRTRAARRAELPFYPVKIFEGDEESAYVHSLSANYSNANRRTEKDKRYAVRRALREYWKRTNSVIADWCRVSPGHVAGQREQVAREEGWTVPKIRIASDGREIDVSNLGRQEEPIYNESLREESEPKDDETATSFGPPPPESDGPDDGGASPPNPMTEQQVRPSRRTESGDTAPVRSNDLDLELVRSDYRGGKFKRLTGIDAIVTRGPGKVGEWGKLARMSAERLSEHGLLWATCTPGDMPEVMEQIGESGLEYLWSVSVVWQTIESIEGRPIKSSTTQILAYSVDGSERGLNKITDWVLNVARDPEGWTAVGQAIGRMMTPRRRFVVDPIAGDGALALGLAESGDEVCAMEQHGLEVLT